MTVSDILDANHLREKRGEHVSFIGTIIAAEYLTAEKDSIKIDIRLGSDDQVTVYLRSELGELPTTSSIGEILLITDALLTSVRSIFRASGNIGIRTSWALIR